MEELADTGNSLVPCGVFKRSLCRRANFAVTTSGQREILRESERERERTKNRSFPVRERREINVRFFIRFPLDERPKSDREKCAGRVSEIKILTCVVAKNGVFLTRQ